MIHQKTGFAPDVSYHGREGLPQLIPLLSIRVAADTPLPSLYLSNQYSKRILHSPIIDSLDQWSYTFTKLHLRSRTLRPGYSLTGLTPTLSMGFRRERFHHPLTSMLHGSGFYHDGASTHKKTLPCAGRAHFKVKPQELHSIDEIEDRNDHLFIPHWLSALADDNTFQNTDDGT